MGHISYLVTKINWTLIPAIAVGGAFFLGAANIIADALKPDVITLTVQITNQGNKPVVKAYKVENGNLTPVK